ncbi:glycoside hydrolase family 88 protein [Saccharopolyspora shandongensis]|uniref:glycoside hydrolase family 88 protein n=1 Tax=Saccharopolyspora shandongensis TaxID=418495 RepID=UPI00341FCD1A
MLVVLALLLLLPPPTPAFAATTVYEAERAARTDAAVESNHLGFTGTGFVNYDNTIGSSLSFTVHAAVAGGHALTFRFANGTGADRSLDVVVNGTPHAISFPSTGSWTAWATRTLRVNLKHGTNVVRATATTAEGGPNLDSLSVDNGVTAPSPSDWSTAVVDSTMARRPATSLGLGYTDALFLHAAFQVYQRTHDTRYLDYVKAWGSARVAADGSTGKPYNDLDSMLVGNVFLDLAQATGDSRYRLAANRIVTRIATYPRASDGALIHNVAFTGQLWSDGAFMAQPFLARAGDHTGPPRQLLTYFEHLRNEDALLRHAYDETRRSEWADTSGRSPEVWCRAVGWFGMATVDVLEELPRTHPDRAALVEIVRYLADGYRRWQDPATGRWFQLPVKPGLAGNWTETSCSAMFTYTLARAVERGYVSPAFWPVAQRGYRGVLAKVSIGSDGRTRISDVVIGTNVGDARYYLERPRMDNDFHGLGAFLIMNEELRSLTSIERFSSWSARSRGSQSCTSMGVACAAGA